MTSLPRRVVARIVTLQEGEAVTALMMFAYSFLAMTSYNILKPITRSKFISALGADNLPYVQLGAGLLIGVLMQLYSRGVGRLPRNWVIPVTQAGEVALLVVFWFLFQTGADWVSVAFYVLALILGILLISQFWTLANDIYDPRQAKRLFGFIGGGAEPGRRRGRRAHVARWSARSAPTTCCWSARPSWRPARGWSSPSCGAEGLRSDVAAAGRNGASAAARRSACCGRPGTCS